MKIQEIRAIAKRWGVNIKVGRSKQEGEGSDLSSQIEHRYHFPNLLVEKN